jgi:hypothetical protein
MSTGEDGFTNYFHCLIISEEVNNYEVQNDFAKEPERSRLYTRDGGDQDVSGDDDSLMPDEILESLKKVIHQKKANPMGHDEADEDILLHHINRKRY